MVDQSRRRLFKATLVSGSSMVLGGSVSQVAAHEASVTDHLRPRISETIDFLSSIYSLEALIGRLYSAWRITLFVFMNQKGIPIGNAEALDKYVQGNNITMDPAKTFQIISALRNSASRDSTRYFISNNEEKANAASNRVDNIVHTIFVGTNSNEVVATTMGSLHHYERIVVANVANSEQQDEPWICGFFPFTYFCKD